MQKLHKEIYYKKFPGVYPLFVSDTEQIKTNCNCEVKWQTHNVAYYLNRNLLEISVLATTKLQKWCLQKTYCVNVRTPFQLVFLPNTCEAYSLNMYITATVGLSNNDPTLIYTN